MKLTSFLLTNLLILAAFGSKLLDPARPKVLFLDKSIQVPNDSLLVKLPSRYEGDILLYFEDEFGNSVPIMPGINTLPNGAVITDSHWQHQISYYIPDTVKSVTFYVKNGFYFIDTGKPQLNELLNFDVSYRKAISPISDKATFFKELEFNTAGYHRNSVKRENDIESRVARKLDFLNEYTRQSHLSQSQLESRRKILFLEKLNNQLFLTDYSHWEKSYLIRLTDLGSEFNSEENLKFPIYRKALKNYVELLCYLHVGNTKPQLKDYQNVIKTTFKGKTRDYLLCNQILASTAKNTGIASYKQQYDMLLRDFYKTCETEEYKEYIQRATFKQAAGENKNLLTITGEPLEFESVLLKNHINYVDFWASWCGPCRAEMPDSQRLKEEYSRGGVNFIYISTDENAAAWQRAMKQIGLLNSENYLIAKGNKSDLVRQFKISSIPRYLIFDKNGELINSDAPRPSSVEIRKLFDDILRR